MKLYLSVFIMLISLQAFGKEELTGKELFRQNCKSCHNIDRKLVGPALKDVEDRRDSSWIYQFILGSTAMIEAGDSVANALFIEYNKVSMPNQKVTHEEIGLILDYIEAESNTPVSEAPFPRPEVNYAYNFTPLQFSEFTFWMPFTIFVLILIGALYYQTFTYDVITGRMKKKDQENNE